MVLASILNTTSTALKVIKLPRILLIRLKRKMIPKGLSLKTTTKEGTALDILGDPPMDNPADPLEVPEDLTVLVEDLEVRADQATQELEDQTDLPILEGLEGPANHLIQADPLEDLTVLEEALEDQIFHKE